MQENKSCGTEVFRVAVVVFIMSFNLRLPGSCENCGGGR